jgi:hypothetical protein
VAIGDPALGEVVWGEFECDPIAGEYADAIATKLAGEVCKNGAFLIELYAVETAWELFYYGSSDFYAIFFAHFPRKMF